MERLAASRLAGWTVTAVLAGLIMLTAGCGSSSGSSAASTPSPATTTSSSSAATANALICQDVAALRMSVTNLTHVQLGSGAVGALTANLDDVKAKLTTLGGVKNSAQDLFTAAGQRCPSPSPSASG